MIPDIDAFLDEHGAGGPDDRSHYALTGAVSASEAYGLFTRRLFDLALEAARNANAAWGPTPEQQAEAIRQYGELDTILFQACQANFLRLVTMDCAGQA